MTTFDPPEPALEAGWLIEGTDGDSQSLRLSFGETELSRAYLGRVVGRHPALCDRVIADPTVSRRHFRLGLANGSLFVEDLNSLNGTFVDGVEAPPFQPVPLKPGQVLSLGRVRLIVAAVAVRGPTK